VVHLICYLTIVPIAHLHVGIIVRTLFCSKRTVYVFKSVIINLTYFRFLSSFIEKLLGWVFIIKIFKFSIFWYLKLFMKKFIQSIQKWEVFSVFFEKVVIWIYSILPMHCTNISNSMVYTSIPVMGFFFMIVFFSYFYIQNCISTIKVPNIFVIIKKKKLTKLEYNNSILLWMIIVTSMR